MLPPVVALGSPDAASAVTGLTSMDVTLEELRTVWNDEHVLQFTKSDNSKWMLCKWCNQEFKNPHATRMLAHLIKKPNRNIQTCKASIPKENHNCYLNLFMLQQTSTSKRKRSQTEISMSVDDSQSVACSALLERRGVSGYSDVVDLVSSDSRATSKSSQMDIATAMDKSGRRMLEISNHAALEMAIADFVICENIPDRVVESPRFANVIKKAIYAGKTFKIPSRKKIAGMFFFLTFIFLLQYLTL